MQHYYNLILFILTIFVLAGSAFCQSPDLNFPTRTKPSELSLFSGSSMISGDIPPLLDRSYTIGLGYQSAINHTLSWRLDALYMDSYGLDFSPSGDELTALSEIYIGYDSQNPIFQNYNFKYFGIALDGFLELTNISPNIKMPKSNVYLGLGLLAGNYSTKLNLRDSEGHAYQDLLTLTSFDLENEFDTKEGRNAIKKHLLSHYDSTYETFAPKEVGKFRPGNETNILFGFNTSIGYSYKLNNRFNISLEHRVSFTYSDYLDGKVLNNEYHMSSNKDRLHTTVLRLSYGLTKSKSEQPLYWKNPWGSLIESLNSKFDYIDSLNIDSDNDGVVDRLDLEPNSIPDCNVGINGITLDSDNDGIPDCQDSTPFGNVKTNTTIDQSSIVDSLSIVNARLRQLSAELDSIYNELNKSKSSKSNQSFIKNINASLPILFFEKGSIDIDESTEKDILEVMLLLKRHPTLKIEIIGHASKIGDSESNRKLSLQRAQKVLDFIEKYTSISKSRLKILAKSEEDPIVKDVGKRLKYNQRVEFRVH